MRTGAGSPAKTMLWRVQRQPDCRLSHRHGTARRSRRGDEPQPRLQGQTIAPRSSLKSPSRGAKRSASDPSHGCARPQVDPRAPADQVANTKDGEPADRVAARCPRTAPDGGQLRQGRALRKEPSRFHRPHEHVPGTAKRTPLPEQSAHRARGVSISALALRRPADRCDGVPGIGPSRSV